ncbi:MAG: glucosamine-6-phosphate deaminase [Prevotellaceae bacterium]|jgi:glucosamine-6-phosphate deaminase|nr:glucosamine-6-phosphate deaminase [Prevotellaceae bacterium]
MKSQDISKRFEKIPVDVFSDSESASKIVAKKIAETILRKQSEGKPCVLGLVAGSTAVNVYEELVSIHKKKGLSFKNVFVFNIDEYYPLSPEIIQSHYIYMYEYLFSNIDIPEENINLLRGDVPKDKVSAFCKSYEDKINELGGIDLQLLSLDGRGQIGANEPGSDKYSETRLITLDYATRMGAASNFYGEENVPRYCLTMGLGTILNAREIILMAWGEGKAKIIKKVIEEKVTEMVPASYLQEHQAVSFILDDASASELTRIKTPWLTGNVVWNSKLIRRAVFWLCRKLDKPILKITDRDYNDNGLGDLISECGPASDINIQVFNDLQHTITGWPGGKPNADDSTRPERAYPFPKRVVIFSPHPDDDVISMGGTFARLCAQGHEVHVAYQTSGNIAVFDDEAVRFLDFVREIRSIYNLPAEITDKTYHETKETVRLKKPGQVDSGEVMMIKGAIRRTEARAGALYVGVPEENIHFLDLPFYETGTVKKKPVGEDDIKIITDLLHEIKPHQIYAAGDMTDPHGTHRVCFQAIIETVRRLQHEEWMKDCRIWMYRGAWQEWDVAEQEMAVPLSPEETNIKRMAIFKHQSQKDRPLFPGTDAREFWQRAEERNHATAITFDKLGMAEYQAIELFVEYKPDKGQIQPFMR